MPETATKTATPPPALAKPAALDVSVIVVSYNTQELTLACLQSIFDHTTRVRYEVIVVDNASKDKSAETIAKQFPRARLFAQEQNLGFGLANNIAARQATGRYLLLLNPDTEVLSGAIDRLVAFADANPGAALFGGRTVFPHGGLNPTSVWRAPSLWGLACRAIGIDNVFHGSGYFNWDAYGGWERDCVREVDIVSGCFMLVRRPVWEQLGGFDPAFFMYGEDWDICMRAARAGYKCLFCPDAEIVHYGGASEPAIEGKMVRLLTTKAQLCRKHWPPVKAAFAVRLLELWVLLRVLGYRVSGAVNAPRRLQYDRWKSVWRERRYWRAAQKGVERTGRDSLREPLG